MSASLTIRKLDDSVKQKLRVRAARHQRSMEAEVRAILAAVVNGPDAENALLPPSENKGKFDHLVGIWAERGTTDSIMKELRDDS